MHGDPRLVEAEQDGLGLHPCDPDTHDVRDPVDGVAIGDDAVDRTGSLQQALCVTPSGLGLLGPAPGLGQCGGGGSETDGADDVLQAGTASSLLLAADQQRVDPQSAAEQ